MALVDDLLLHRTPHPRTPPPGPPPRAVRWLGALVGVLCGLVLVVAALHARTGVPVTAQQRSLVAAVDDRRTALDGTEQQLRELRAAVASAATAPVAPAALPSAGPSGAAAALPAEGSGVVLRLVVPTGADQAVQDRDLQQLANDLWAAGAGAVALDGVRLGPRTAIRTAGSTVLVGYRPVSPPYVLSATAPGAGGGAALRARVLAGPAREQLADLAAAYDVGWSLSSRTVSLPAASPAPLRLASPAPGGGR
ncbi:uncharacterized protein YlxW (UPF0749 family) [Motilibacter rhizosphaerae]|uniref:Uncharacterized protein YlxW (UPF0749 family) n=2 Tax=Motilibacter rhizosphaerae TaxID=598652 RepID=A0A4Q7NB67_9ACTN|nr:uncharacterized protein YlxW (UPF0749 family) [Motilibacter rhizosphaerae]